MWEPQHLTNLWASKTCYRDSFTFLHLPLYVSVSFDHHQVCMNRTTNIQFSIYDIEKWIYLYHIIQHKRGIFVVYIHTHLIMVKRDEIFSVVYT
jgi:hypothetical protein